VDTSFKVKEPVRDILRKEGRMITLVLDIMFYGGIVIAILSGVIKLLIKIYG
jgi:hypothetical protein